MLWAQIPGAEVVTPEVWEKQPLAAALLLMTIIFVGVLLAIVRVFVKTSNEQRQDHAEATRSLQESHTKQTEMAQQTFIETLQTQERGCVEQTKHICERFDQTTKQMFELLRGRSIGNGS
jgi:hypothetical protein